VVLHTALVPFHVCGVPTAGQQLFTFNLLILQILCGDLGKVGVELINEANGQHQN
jgi:hypothetical protein